jgi:hypothetical protein
MIFNCGLPIRFWGNAVKYASYVLNRSPSRSNLGRKSPFEQLEGKRPSLLYIVAFGFTCMVYRDSNGRTFKKHATRGIIHGIPEDTKGYIVYLKEDQKVVNTQHAKFIETLSSTQNATLLALPSSNKESSNARFTSARKPGDSTINNRMSTHTPDLRL